MIGHPALEAIGQLADAEIDIAGAAVQLARARAPDADWQRAAAHLSSLAREAAGLGAAMDGRSPEVRLGALAGLIHAHHGYAGDVAAYDDLANADLIRVTERRLGLPVALGVLWLHCIRAAGWHGCGIDFPGHFLIRLGDEPLAATRAKGAGRPAPAVLVDVFAGGTSVGTQALLAMARRRSTDAPTLPPDLIRPMTDRQVLVRLQRNIVERLRIAGQWQEALREAEMMTSIAPQDAFVWRDQATLQQSLGHLRAAIACLERFIELAPAGTAVDHARVGIDTMRRRLA